MKKLWKYYVLSRKSAEQALTESEHNELLRLLGKVESHRVENGKQPTNGVFIKDDTPIHDFAWTMVEAHVDGHYVPLPEDVETTPYTEGINLLRLYSSMVEVMLDRYEATQDRNDFQAGTRFRPLWYYKLGIGDLVDPAEWNEHSPESYRINPPATVVRITPTKGAQGGLLLDVVGSDGKKYSTKNTLTEGISVEWFKPWKEDADEA